MHQFRALDVRCEEATAVDGHGEDSTRQPNRSPHLWHISKLALAVAFLAAAGYFFHEQVWTSSSLEGTVTSPLITIRSPMDGVVTPYATTVGATVDPSETLFVIKAHQLDTRLRAELAAKLAAAQQQALVIDRKITELSTLRTQLQTRQQLHRDATLSRLEALISETTADLNRAKAVQERAQRELTRANTLSANALIAQTTVDDAVLAGQQARFDVERFTASLKRLHVERTAAKNGVLLGEGYGDAPYSQQRLDELAARLIEAEAERHSIQQTQDELASRLGEEQRREEQLRTYTVHAPIVGLVWNLHIAADGVVGRNSPLADMVDCGRAYVEATLPESRYDDVQIGETVHVKLLGNRQKISGRVHAVRGQSAVVNRDSLAAWLSPHRTTEAMTVSVAIDPTALQQVSQGVCQVGRSAKVYFNKQDEGTFTTQRLASLAGFMSSAVAAIVPSGR